jgi:secondary thiamine-phosphate synthase enzyme
MPTSISVTTRRRGFYDVTARVQRIVRESGVRDGLCTVFVHHTSASVVVCENADPAVQHDLQRFFDDLAPDGDPRFTHTAEGPDDMSAHVRSVLTQASLSLPVVDGRCDLGTWQGVYLWEHRHDGSARRLSVTVVASAR